MLAPASVLTHLVTAMSEGELVDLDPELPAPERFDEIAAALEQADTVSAAHELLRAPDSRCWKCGWCTSIWRAPAKERLAEVAGGMELRCACYTGVG